MEKGQKNARLENSHINICNFRVVSISRMIVCSLDKRVNEFVCRLACACFIGTHLQQTLKMMNPWLVGPDLHLAQHAP